MKKRVQIFVGLVVGAALIWYLFKDTDWGEVYAAVLHMNWWWMLLALGAMLVSLVTRVFRWGYIVRTAQPVPFRALFTATQIGFLANFTLPARAGEFIRAFALSRLTGLTMSRCFAFVALDRVTDLIGLIVTMLIAVAAYRPTQDVYLPGNLKDYYSEPISGELIRNAALGTAMVLLCVVAMFVVLYLQQRLALRISDRILGLISTRLAEKVHVMLQHFADGMHVFRSAKDMAKSISWSLVTWALFAVSYWGGLMAFNIDVPWYAPFMLMSLLAVFISVPGPPGFVGPFHVAIVGGIFIVNPNIDMDVAKAMAIVAHLMNLIPIVLIGLACMYIEGFHVMELRKASPEAEGLDEAEAAAE